MSELGTPPVLSPPLTSISFSLSLADLIKCRLWVIHHHKMIIAIYLVGSLLVPLMDLNDSKLAEHTMGFRVFVFFFSAVIALAFVMALNIVLQIVMAVAAKNRGLVGRHEIQIDDEQLTEKTDFNTSSFRWAGFHKVSESASYLFIYVTDNNVLYVPKRCFSSSQEMKEFKDLILKRTGKFR